MKITPNNQSLIRIVAFALIGLCLSWALVTLGFKLGMVLLIIPPLVIFVIISFSKPAWLLHMVVIMGFLISLLSRYLPGIPFGLSIDAILVLTILVLVFDKNIEWESKAIMNPLVLVLIVWLGFSFVELFNPLAKSKVAWFYANRGLSFYPLLISILTLYVYKKSTHLNQFLWIWIGLSIFGTLWGLKQLFLGVSNVEQQWLNAGAASTHILFGRLRVFSFYSDAAQFGASQAHTALVFGIIGIFVGQVKYRFVYLGVALVSIYGMLISGTRGAIAILAIGGFVYFIMTKNFKVVAAGILAGVLVFSFLKFTTIGQSNYQINRLRTALDSDDPSLQVRKEREKVLDGYLSDKPLGEGIGSAGYWGKRFSPGTFLAEIGTDGHYTRVWMETGIIGLWLYLLIIFIVLFSLGRLLWNMPQSLTRQKLLAFYSGFAGICVASYSNGLLTQIPTGILTFVSLAFILLLTREKKET